MKPEPIKGRALRRALQTEEADRVFDDLPPITDRTERITPEVAEALLQRNRQNRPINWRAVERYAEAMQRGEWRVHSQGIILDTDGNILTGQQRLWAVIVSGVGVYMRVSRNNPREVASLLDRGRPQSARDLASRRTERRHSPVEASIARAMCVLAGTGRPGVDALADAVTRNAARAEIALRETAGTKKSKAVIMVLAALCARPSTDASLASMCRRVEQFARALDGALAPESADSCWGRGAAFRLAMERAAALITDACSGDTA